MKIATHNSASCERSKNWLYSFLVPFARCQSKSIGQQLQEGVRWFDLRFDDNFNIAHGMWKSKTSLFEVLSELNSFGEKLLVNISYEGSKLSDAEVIEIVNNILLGKANLMLVRIGSRNGGWHNVIQYICPPEDCCFKCMGESWHTLIPIPWLWKKIYFDKVEFDDERWRVVDFL